MRQEIGNGSTQAGTHDPTEPSSFVTLARIERDLNDVIEALALLGVKRCVQCRKFLRNADPGALFESGQFGQFVCYDCIPVWWSSQSMRLGVADRERIEGKLASWLRKHHRAEIVKSTAGAVPDTSNAEFQIVAKCNECAGSGKLMEGERCRFCNGLGTVRIVVPK
jgi:hypothetical protein